MALSTDMQIPLTVLDRGSLTERTEDESGGMTGTIAVKKRR